MFYPFVAVSDSVHDIVYLMRDIWFAKHVIHRHVNLSIVAIHWLNSHIWTMQYLDACAMISIDDSHLLIPKNG